MDPRGYLAAYLSRLAVRRIISVYETKPRYRKMTSQLNLGLLVLLSIGITGCSAMTEDNHKVDMQELKQYCQTHSKEACDKQHMKIHMSHHGGTEQDFHDHHKKKHGKEEGKTD